MNEDAKRRMRALVELAIVPGASHLFEEPGTLEAVSARAQDWFGRYLRPLGADLLDGVAPREV